MKRWPALEIRNVPDLDLLLAALDDYQPTAIDERGSACLAFFASVERRDAAHAALDRQFAVDAIDVPDEDWARRSQENLTPVTVGRIVVAPPWYPPSAPFDPEPARAGAPLTIVIVPSMGFGTGHHATTRLCLKALQTVNLAGRFVLDVGTGSGVLAIAASRLGAREAVGIDADADAIQSANENLAENPGLGSVRFVVGDLRTTVMPRADVVLANLTGALLIQGASVLLSAVTSGGALVLSGLQTDEREGVVGAFARAALFWESAEDGWIGLAFNV